MLASDWLNCIGFWRGRENYPQKDIVWRYWSFLKKKGASPLCCSDESTDTLVVNTCSHWRRCWRLKELQKSHSKALESHLVRTRESTMASHIRFTFGHSRQEKRLSLLTSIEATSCTCCAELSHHNNLYDTTTGEPPCKSWTCWGSESKLRRMLFY